MGRTPPFGMPRKPHSTHLIKNKNNCLNLFHINAKFLTTKCPKITNVFYLLINPLIIHFESNRRIIGLLWSTINLYWKTHDKKIFWNKNGSIWKVKREKSTKTVEKYRFSWNAFTRTMTGICPADGRFIIGQFLVQ